MENERSDLKKKNRSCKARCVGCSLGPNDKKDYVPEKRKTAHKCNAVSRQTDLDTTSMAVVRKKEIGIDIWARVTNKKKRRNRTTGQGAKKKGERWQCRWLCIVARLGPM